MSEERYMAKGSVAMGATVRVRIGALRSKASRTEAQTMTRCPVFNPSTVKVDSEMTLTYGLVFRA